jgi:murein DD-endopeptidase MepM/ murein hydrolase activator NlpD
LLRAVLVVLALFIANAASAEEMKSPHISLAPVDWDAAAASLPGRSAAPPADVFAGLNAAAQLSFPDIGKSSVPVLLPFDVDALRQDQTAGKAGIDADSYLRGSFHSAKFFLAGPAGFDSAFSLLTADVPEVSDIRYRDPVYVLFSGLRFVYELDGPPLPEGTPVKDLEADFPGIQRYLHESYIRYSFRRYGVTYVAAIYCLDTHPRAKILTCKQADRIAERFLRALKLAGGTPAPARPSIEAVALERPERVSKDFSYFSPGFLIPGTGFKKEISGRADYTIYARLRFPLKQAPDFANSQSFNNWGDCDFTGRSRRDIRAKGAAYSCRVNGRALVFDESTNYAYPWRDNFCEHRNFFVGQCAGGEGHQGQDIRPSSCTLFNDGADRCLPYQHDVVAAHDGQVLRARKQEAVFLFINTPNAHLRVRYIHMNPDQLDADGILSGKFVQEGEVIGKVGNYNNRERGTTYHLHFDMQVPTKVGFVFVNPYTTLVAAYEHLIGARGSEIKEGDPVPSSAPVPPVVEHPAAIPATAEVPAVQSHAVQTAQPPAAETQENAALRAKPHIRSKPHRHHHVRRKSRHKHDDE